MLRRAALSCMAMVVLIAAVSPVLAARPAHSLLPPTTKAYVSVPDVQELRTRWEQTQFGLMAKDPAMRPFVDDLQAQLEDRVGGTRGRLSVRWGDLREIAGGEVAVAAIQPGGDPKQHAVLLLVDTTGRTEQTQALLNRVEQDLLKRGAKKSTGRAGEVSLTHFAIPPREGSTRGQEAMYFVHQSWLVATDHRDVVGEVVARLQNPDLPSFGQTPAFGRVMQQAEQAVAGLEHQLQWFVEPFGYAEVVRAAAGGRRRPGTDILQVLKNQGFTAIQGVGGYISLTTENGDIVHRSFVYAPQSYQLAARMLDFPNGGDLEPQSWVPAGVATYLSFQWNMKDAFEYSKSLVNELLDAEPGDDIFEDVLNSIKTDPLGPQIDIRRDLVAYFKDRATVITDYREPVTPQSERLLFAIDLTDPARVAETLKKAFANDPTVQPHQHNGHTIYEMREAEDEEVPTLQIDGPGFGRSFGEEEPEEEEGDKLLPPNSAITVANGQLWFASHLDYIIELIDAQGQKSLATAPEYQRVQQTLVRLGGGQDSFRSFARTSEANRTTYELLRKGQMPQSETLLGRILNRLYGSEEQGVQRAQQINAGKLPEFTQVEKYFGPAGVYVRSETDGWTIVGTVLPNQPQMAAR